MSLLEFGSRCMGLAVYFHPLGVRVLWWIQKTLKMIVNYLIWFVQFSSYSVKMIEGRPDLFVKTASGEQLLVVLISLLHSHCLLLTTHQFFISICPQRSNLFKIVFIIFHFFFLCVLIWIEFTQNSNLKTWNVDTSILVFIFYSSLLCSSKNKPYLNNDRISISVLDDCRECNKCDVIACCNHSWWRIESVGSKIG